VHVATIIRAAWEVRWIIITNGCALPRRIVINIIVCGHECRMVFSTFDGYVTSPHAPIWYTVCFGELCGNAYATKCDSRAYMDSYRPQIPSLLASNHYFKAPLIAPRIEKAMISDRSAVYILFAAGSVGNWHLFSKEVLRTESYKELPWKEVMQGGLGSSRYNIKKSTSLLELVVNSLPKNNTNHCFSTSYSAAGMW
jgi:hypothetical protein